MEPWWNESKHIYFKRIANIEKKYAKASKKKFKIPKILPETAILSTPSLQDPLLESSEGSFYEQDSRRYTYVGGESMRGSLRECG